MATYIKPTGITGLNTSHTNYADIQAFYEIGQTDKELVDDTSITTTAVYSNDSKIGDARIFDADSDVITETETVTHPFTALVVVHPTGVRANGSASEAKFIFYEGSGDHYELMYEGFGGGNFKATSRGNFGSYRQMNGTSFPNNPAFGTGHAIAQSLDDAATMTQYLNGSAAGTNTGTTNQGGSRALSLMSKIAADGTMVVGAIVIFNKVISGTDLATITADPWDLLSTGGGGSIVPQIMHHRRLQQ